MMWLLLEEVSEQNYKDDDGANKWGFCVDRTHLVNTDNVVRFTKISEKYTGVVLTSMGFDWESGMSVPVSETFICNTPFDSLLQEISKRARPI